MTFPREGPGERPLFHGCQWRIFRCHQMEHWPGSAADKFGPRFAIRSEISAGTARGIARCGPNSFLLTSYLSERIFGSNGYPKQQRTRTPRTFAGYSRPANSAHADFRPTTRPGNRPRDSANF